VIGILHEVPSIVDSRGKLSIIEFEKIVNFTIKRVYWLYQIQENAIRGGHAHKQLRQLIVALNGSVEIVLDNGKNKSKHVLNSPSLMLEIGPNVWREIVSFINNPIVMILASELYEEDDYIRNYEDFIKHACSIS